MKKPISQVLLTLLTLLLWCSVCWAVSGLEGTPVGATDPSTGKFTNLEATTQFKLGSDTASNFEDFNNSKAKVSSDDTTPGFLNGKLIQGSGITFIENSGGGNETLEIAANQKLDTKGDLLTHNGSGDSALAVGTDGQVLVVDSASANGIKWDTATDLSAPGPIGATTPSTGEFTDLNATGNLKLQGLAYVTFAIEIKNNSGTIQHRSKHLRSPNQPGTASWPSGITGLSSTFANTPVVSSSVGFTNGVGILTRSPQAILELDWAADQNDNNAHIQPEVIFDSTGSAHFVLCERDNIDINATTKNRNNLFLFDSSGNQVAWNTTTIPSGKSMIILVKGWAKI
ncbi:MAG: hypothetical protein HON56_00160 [Nitrospina sp.]|jgi:hypothetical protein|nr:hypothetical protein [Nitrospina sp.]